MPEPPPAGMDMAKRMMQKWGWSKGQGLGKDNHGMTSCLILRKTDGSNTQGRIEQAPQAAAQAAYIADPATAAQTAAAAAAVAASAVAVNDPAAAAAAMVAAAAAAEMGVTVSGDAAAEAAAAAAAVMAGEDPEQAAKRRRTSKWDGQGADPNDPAAVAAAFVAAANQQAPGVAMAVYDPVQAQIMAAQQAAVQGQAPAQEMPKPSSGLKPGIGPKPRPARRWIWRQPEDWRWSKGTEILRWTQELDLPSHMQTLARKILSEDSRYPRRFTDITDCVVEFTAWGTLLLRPNGTSADTEKAKRMLYEVFHPSQHALRKEYLEAPDDDDAADVDLENSEEAALRNLGEDRAVFEQGLERSAHGKLNRVGLGAEDEVRKAAKEKEKEKLQSEEVILPTAEDVALVRAHMEDLKIASGVSALLSDANLKLIGKAKPLRKAKKLLNTLLETGEWVALESGFVLSEETKKKRAEIDGPSEQILIKVPEGKVTLLIEKKLKLIERAAEADQLKLTSKPIAGKRTLMVEGSKKAHERVKLMVKELSEKGESPMLTKAINRKAAEETPSTANVAPSAPAAAKVPEQPKGPLPDGAAAVAGMRLMAPPKKIPAGAAATATGTPTASTVTIAPEVAAGGLFSDLPEPGAADATTAPSPMPAPIALPAGPVPTARPSTAPAAATAPSSLSVDLPAFPPEPPILATDPEEMSEQEYLEAAMKAAERQLMEIASIAASGQQGVVAAAAPQQAVATSAPGTPALVAAPSVVPTSALPLPPPPAGLMLSGPSAAVAAEAAAATALAAALEAQQQQQQQQVAAEAAAATALAAALEAPALARAAAAAPAAPAPAAPAATAPAPEPAAESGPVIE